MIQFSFLTAHSKNATMALRFQNLQNRPRIVTRARLTTDIGEDDDDNDDETAFCTTVLSFRSKQKSYL